MTAFFPIMPCDVLTNKNAAKAKAPTSDFPLSASMSLSCRLLGRSGAKFGATFGRCSGHILSCFASFFVDFGIILD